ncbi:MAG: Fic family protein [Clostridiaceae bacterium]
MEYKNRAGTFIQQEKGYVAFIPKKLPPNPNINYDFEIISLLSAADRRLGRLDGITQTLPNPDLFVAMYVKKEAVLSSQIEGTQASLIDVLNEDESENGIREKNIEEVVNYIDAMNYGLKRLKELPLSLRLIREIHAILLKNGRGSERNPGEFRRTQNWIGPGGCTLTNAIFVPPPVHDMTTAMNELENFIYEDNDMPPLVKIALIHAQFETIHPFLDGNGRMGRLLITFWLCHQNILTTPLLYLSYYFKMNRIEYYDRLMNVRKKGDWEGWIKFFLNGVAFVSDESINMAKEILKMKEEHIRIISEKAKNAANGLKLLDYLFEYPIISINKVKMLLEVAYPTANSLVAEFCELGILEQVGENIRNRKYIYNRYVTLLNAGTEITK